MANQALKQTLSDAQDTLLVVIDMQTHRLPGLEKAPAERARINVEKLVIGARVLSIPSLVTEQTPKQWGHTLPSIAKHTLSPSRPAIEKTTFSAAHSSRFIQLLAYANRSQVILTGVEAHVALLQTAMALLAQEVTVFIPEDAVASRQSRQCHNALARLREAGAIISNTESVLFEWLGGTQHPKFSKISDKVLRRETSLGEQTTG